MRRPHMGPLQPPLDALREKGSHASAAELMAQLTSALGLASAASEKGRRLLSSSVASTLPERSEVGHAAGASASGGGGGVFAAPSPTSPPPLPPPHSTAPLPSPFSTENPLRAAPSASAPGSAFPPPQASPALPAPSPAPAAPSARSGAAGELVGQQQQQQQQQALRLPLPDLEPRAHPSAPGAVAGGPFVRTDAELATSWVRRWSSAKRAYFYVNCFTRKSSWLEPPPTHALYAESAEDGRLKPLPVGGGQAGGALQQQPQQEQRRVLSGAGVFVQKWSEAKGAPFFVNAITLEAHWVLPEGGVIAEHATPAAATAAVPWQGRAV